jgi:hypothetical protein
VVKIPEVMLYPGNHRLETGSGSPPSVYLCPPGNTRLDAVAFRIERNESGIYVVMGNCMRTRPNKGHFSPDHIQYLRQFIQAELPKDSAHSGHARIVPAGLLDERSIVECSHGAELIDVERPAIQTTPSLPKQNRFAGVQPYKAGDNDQSWQHNPEHHDPHHQVEAVLQRTLRIRQRARLAGGYGREASPWIVGVSISRRMPRPYA